MSKFTTIAKDLRSTIVYIQGAQRADSNNAVSGVIFQNYDDDTKMMYNMAEISAVDHYGNSAQNGWGDLRLATSAGNNSNVERMRILYDGRVGVGTPSPSELIECNGGNICIRGEGRGLVFKNSDGTVIGAFTNCNGALTSSIAQGGGGVADVAMSNIDRASVGVWDVSGSNIYFSTDCNVGTGNVGIGTSAPGQKLSVRGNIHCTSYVYADSDARFKTDLVPIDRGLDKAMALRGFELFTDFFLFADKLLYSFYL